MKKTADGAHQLKEVLSKGKEPHLMNGQQYIDSLNDGRRIIDADGNEVKNIADHPALKNAVKHLSELYDQQFDPETQDIATYVGDDGNRYSLAWKIPRTIEDLKERRKLLRLSTFHTLGVFGRPNDYGSMKSMGYLLIIDRIREKNPELADNIERFIDFSKEHNLMSTNLVPNVQSDRTVPSNERPGNLRIVEERPDGVVLQGAKPVGSNAVLSHFVTISTGLSPDLGPNEALWIAVPVNADGLKMILRESTVDSDSSFDDHPIDSLEEESGGAGTLDAILNGYTADAAIIPEPTNMRIFPKQQGSKWFRLTVTGRTAHGGTPYLGVSAIDKAMIVNAHMKALEKVRNDRMTDPLYDNIPVPIPINIGKVSGGDWPSSVPDVVTFEGRIGVAPGETMEEVRQETEEWLEQLSEKDEWFQQNPVTIEWFGARWVPGEIDIDHPLVESLVKNYENIVEKSPVIEASPWGTDGGLLTQVANTPVVVFGPGTTNLAHYPNESIEMDKIVEAAKIMAATVVDWCGVEE